MHFTADAELRERARALASHRIPNGDLASLMTLMVASFVQREAQRRFGIGTRARRTKAKAQATNVRTDDLYRISRLGMTTRESGSVRRSVSFGARSQETELR